MNADGWLERLGLRGGRPPSVPRAAAGVGSAARRRSRRRAIPRPGPRLIAALALVVAVLAGGWLWLRDSSLVAVRRVTVTGVSGPDARRIRSALVIAARNMTTLDVKTAALDTAVAPYPVVKSIQVSTQFPHGMRIHVIEEFPVGEITMGGRTIAVASDGTLVHDAGSLPPLPTISLRSLPGAGRISDRAGVELVSLLAAAPYQLLSHLSEASSTPTHGLTATLRNGPRIYFGGADRLAAKWSAAVAVLANSGSAGATYIDVSDPERPVAGTSTASATAAGTSGTGSTGTGTGVTGAGTNGSGGGTAAP